MLFTIQDWCPWCPGHMGWGGGWLMMLLWLVGLVLLILVVWALVRGRQGRGPGPSDRDPAEEILREQFARGEMDEDTYRRRLQELRGE
jgi:putative membrane protein